MCVTPSSSFGASDCPSDETRAPGSVASATGNVVSVTVDITQESRYSENSHRGWAGGCCSSGARLAMLSDDGTRRSSEDFIRPKIPGDFRSELDGERARVGGVDSASVAATWTGWAAAGCR